MKHGSSLLTTSFLTLGIILSPLTLADDGHVKAKANTKPAAGARPIGYESERELANKVGLKKSDVAYGRALLGTVALAHKYDIIRNSDTLKQEFTLLRRAGYISVKAGQSINSVYSGSLGLIGAGLLASQLSAGQNRAVAFRLGGGLTVIAALNAAQPFLYASSLSSGGNSSLSLAGGNKELTLGEIQALKRQLEINLESHGDVIGGVLKWTPSQKEQFREAVEEYVVRNVKSSLPGPEGNPFLTTLDQDALLFRDVKFKLPTVDYLKIIEEKALASNDEIAALKAMREAYDVIEKVEASKTPSEAKQHLTAKGALESNIQGMEHVIAVMEQVVAELKGKKGSPDQADALSEAETLVARGKSALEVVRGISK